MQVFLTILVVVLLALVATSRRLYTLRRRRPMIVLIAGGWIGMAAGVLLGPSVAGLISTGAVEQMTPLLMVGMGWIGLLVGLQLRRRVVVALPRTVVGLAVSDSAASLLVFGLIGLAGMLIWADSTGAGWLIGPVALVACASIGWSMETRSLRVGEDAASRRLELLVRASAALGGVAAVGVFGVAASLASRDSAGGMRIDLVEGLIRVGACVALAVAASFLVHEGLRLSGRVRDNQFVVFLGVVALVAGVASQFRVPTIFAAMLVGVIIANMRGVDLRQFERFLLKAEHVIAAMFALLAGVLLNTGIGGAELVLALSIGGVRLLFKSTHFRWWTRRTTERELGGEEGALAVDSALYVGPVRQSPLAIVLAVSFVLLEDRSEFSTRLLTVIAIAGFVSDLIPLSASIARHGVRRSSGERKAREGWEGAGGDSEDEGGLEGAS